MPLVKQRGFKFSILCDVFLLIFLTTIVILISVVTCVPTITTTKFTLNSQLKHNKHNLSSHDNKIDNKTTNNNNNHINNNKELSLQYAELETLKTISKHFDIYSDFNKISFDTIHRILRDEEPEFRNDDQRIQHRWKKSTLISTDVVDNIHHQQKHHHQHHIIGKRSSSINDENNYEFSFSNNYDNNNNNDNFNYNYRTSSNDSTKIINLANKNYSTETINKILLKQIKNLTEIEHLNLKNNNISNFSMLFNHNNDDKLVNLKYLDLSNNKLKFFHLKNTSKLKILNLSKNQITNFTLTSSLSSSALTKTSSLSGSVFQNNSNLIELNLSKNNLTSVKYINVTMLNVLEIFDLSCNHIQHIDKNYFSGQMKSLKRLNLSGNKLDGILKEPFHNLLNIDTLILSNNNISIIDLETFLVLPNLQYLDLSFNNIQGSSIRALQGISNLVGLSIAYNPKLGDSLQEFVASWSLKELDISGTGLCQIPAALAQSVRSLKLVNNWFEIIRCGDLDSYPLLQYLDLSYSHIQDIEDDALGRLEILETLFLDHNNLNRVPISLPINLENLFLQNNQIMDIQPQTFQALINLKVLDLSGNKIMYLPGLPLPKLLTLNLQSCELRGLSQSVVKTSPKLRDLFLDGNPIKCTDLLGIAEWASPCQSERISEPSNIKKYFQNIHNYFQHFGRINEKLCEDNCSDNCKINELKKPTCANDNRTKKRINKTDTQIQRYDSDINDYYTGNDYNLNRTLNFMRKQTVDTKKIHMKTGKRQNITINRFNTARKRKFFEMEKEKHSNNQSLFMNNPNSGNYIFNSSLLSLSNKNTAVPNEHEINIKILEKLFNGTNTNQELHKNINNENGSITNNSTTNNKNKKDNEKNTLFNAKIPILSLSYNSNESFIGDVTHENTTVVKEKISENIGQQQEKKRGMERKIISNIKSDNNYVETSVLFESINRQKKEQNESQFELRTVHEENIEKLEIPENMEGRKPSKNIEILPRKQQNSTSSNIINKKFQINITNKQNYSDTSLKIDNNHTDTSNPNKFKQINRKKSIMVTQQPNLQIRTLSSVLLHNNQEIPINDQQLLSDDANLKFESTVHVMASPSNSPKSRKILNNKKDQTSNITNNKRKLNLPETKSNLQENNSQNYKRKTIKDNINTELTSLTSSLTKDISTSATITATEKMKTISTTASTITTIPSMLNKDNKIIFFDQPLVTKKNDIVNRNQNILYSLGQDYHQIETIKQEAVSTNIHNKSQKPQQKQLKGKQQQHVKRLLHNKTSKQKLPNLKKMSNDTSISLFQKDNYNLNASQQKKLDIKTTIQTDTIIPTAINSIQVISDKQKIFNETKNDNEAVTISNKSLTYGTINTDNSNKNNTHYVSSLSLPDNIKITQIISNVTKTNSTNLKRNKEKQQRKSNIKNQKIQAINLENSPLMKNENENYNSEENFPIKNILKNFKLAEKQKDSEMKMTTPSKFSSQTHHYLNTPNDFISSNLNYINVDTATTIMKNDSVDNKTDDIYDTEKLTTHSLMHHTVNTAILPYTVDDYAFERSGYKGIHENSDALEEKSLPVKLKKLQSMNFDILSSYANDEPIHQESENNFHLNTNMETTTTQQNHKLFNSEFSDTQKKDNISKHLNSLLNQTTDTKENFNLMTKVKNNNSNSKITTSYTSNINSTSNIRNNSENGLPPEHWLDIRKATRHPGLFIVIGVTFGMIVTLGLIHIYRCRRPYHNQKGPHPLHHHHQHQHHSFPHNFNRNQYNHYFHKDDQHRYNNNIDEYTNSRHSLNNMFDNDCHCNEEDYYIEADHESQSSSRRDFLPMELLNLNGNTEFDSHTINDDGNSNRTRRNNNSHNLDIW